MESTAHRAVAIVGLGAILPEAPDVAAFWRNVKNGRYSISDVTPDRWDPVLYYDPDPKAPEKTYSKIGGWVREWEWNPLQWGLPVPPRVMDAMDDGQKWAVACTRAALADYGYPGRPLEAERTAVILGNAMAGEKHYLTALRVYFPEYAAELSAAASFAALPAAVRDAIRAELHTGVNRRFPDITEDTMPGELANCIAGRVANLFNFHGPNFVVDAACASAMAAISAAVEGLTEHDYDAVIAGGVDRNMGASSYVKFCKIGALSATGTRPYADGADGFVMGEGAAIFLLKRLADAERAGDKVYAVVRGVGGSSDGKGKGITAPNPVGQRLCIQRAWENAGLSPATATIVEGHGTSTRVGDVVEVQSLTEVFAAAGAAPASVALGSVKSNIGHLKAAAGAAGLLKAVLALHDKVIPPSLHCDRPNPNIDFAHSPFYVNTALAPWPEPPAGARRAGVSAFGFGGTNFHLVIEEHIPGRLARESGDAVSVQVPASRGSSAAQPAVKAPLRGALVIGAESAAGLTERLRAIVAEAAAGRAPALALPAEPDLRAPERVAIDYGDAAELADKGAKALKALQAGNPAMWKALRAQGIHRGQGPAPKVAFLYTGQGSQYVNMLRRLCETEPIVRDTFTEADRVMTPLLGKPLREHVFAPEGDAAALALAEEGLRQTEITQPAVLTVDAALTRMLAAYGIVPDMVMGHSLGEYGALVAAHALPLADALEAVSARGREMANLSIEDNGKMAAVFAPIGEIERLLKDIDGYVVIANVNSNSQAVIGGASTAVDRAVEVFQSAGFNAVELPVSHAFHTAIVAPASEPLRRTLERLQVQSPELPIVANVTGELYPVGPGVVPQMVDLLARQVASPVQFVKGLHTLYAAGARVFVEVGPKKALQGFVDDIFADRSEVISLFTNHPKLGDEVAFNQALCGLYAAGVGVGQVLSSSVPGPTPEPPAAFAVHSALGLSAAAPAAPGRAAATTPASAGTSDRYVELGRLFAEFLERGREIYFGTGPAAGAGAGPVVITGAALGLPGTERVFDDDNIGRILSGEQFIDVIPTRLRRAMLDKHITRLVKSDGDPHFEVIDDPAEVIKLAARAGGLDLAREFGVSAERLAALDVTTRLAIGAGLDALRDAGIPLVMHYRTTTKGTQLPDRWRLPEALRDETGVIFASAFPGYDAFARELQHYHEDRTRRETLALLEDLRLRAAPAGDGRSPLLPEIERRIHDLRTIIERDPYHFDRRFLFRILAMGHSQFAELIGARGPNTQLNAACASTTQAVAVAEDWIRAGRCRRVIIIAGDDVTSDHLLEWIGAGFLASGAAATDDVVEEAAIPFDRRRHGMLLGMGAAAVVVESADAARERGIRPICEVLGAVTANSAFHGTRLDVHHISAVMETLVAQAERRWGVRREQIAPETVFVSHETYTPARGGSAAAEVEALRHVFADAANRIVVANTKGFTGHPMGVGIEDVVAIKALETGLVPPVPNFKEIDPELGQLNLSRGGTYPVRYALRLGAGFGSQISMTLIRWMPTPDGTRPSPDALGYASRVDDAPVLTAWLDRVSGQPKAELEVVQRTLRIRDNTVGSRQYAVGSTDQTIGSPKPALGSEGRRVGSEERVESSEAAGGELPTAYRLLPTDQGELPTADRPLPTDAVKDRVLALVAEKTGYPPDMLDLDLDLEADLGVDTVKQAEVFATIREAYDIPRDTALKLRDFPTLAHVIRFVQERRPDLTVGSMQYAVGSAERTVGGEERVESSEAVGGELPTAYGLPPTDPIKDRVLALVAEKTGYPPDMLDLDLDLEADLGVDTVKQAEVFATIREAYDIPRDTALKLRDFPTLAHVIRFVQERRPDLTVGSRQYAVGSTDQTVGSPKSALGSEDRRVGSEERVESSEAGGGELPTAYSLPPTDPIKDRVLALVAEKTGYPPDMLDLDLDLEADLGVDTVKQAEVFASVREAYGIPRDTALKLRDFPTLAHVIRFVQERRPDLTVGSRQYAVGSTEKSSEAGHGELPTAYRLLPTDRVPRRVPVATLRPPLALCKPTGVRLGSGSRVVVMPDDGGVATALGKRLKKLGAHVCMINPSADVDALTRTLETWKGEGTIQGVYWLAALDDEGDLSAMDLSRWRAALERRVKRLYTTMRSLYEQIATPGTFLVCSTRMGGRHGYDSSGALASMGGAVAGFAKAYKRERTEALVKAVDFAADAKAAEVADALMAETLTDPGAVEVGHHTGQRWTVALEEQPLPAGEEGLRLGRDSVFVVTGAAGGIVSAIVADLAAASGGTFHLLDKVAEPDPANPDLARFVSDRDGLKRDLFDRIKARGERATPALVERELAALERAQAALAGINAVRAAGGIAHYHAVDLTDAEAVARVIDAVRRDSGRIDALVHAAGVEVSHLLPDKSPREFDLVFDVKCDGWFNLLHAVGTMPLGATVVFSSIAGRFGNGGQTDYSAANDLLCRVTSHLRRSRPETRALAIDWTAWGGIGMATRGSIPVMMQAAGIDMLAPEAGIPVVRRELSAGARGEVVIAERLGVLANEWDATGGLDPSALGARLTKGRLGPMIGAVVRMGIHDGLTVETTLDPTVQPFLHDHQIDGTPVLPGVMGLEAFAEVAQLMLPEWYVVGIENVEFLAPFKFYRGAARTLTIQARFRPDGDDIVADCRLLGQRTLAGQTQPQTTTHFAAAVRLARQPPAPVTAVAPDGAPQEGAEPSDIYRVYFHGPAYQVVERAWREGQQAVGRLTAALPANHSPADAPLALEPRLVELCFQTAGLWELGTKGRMALPQRIECVRVHRRAKGAAQPLFAVVTPRASGTGFDAQVVDGSGNVHVSLAGYGTIELPSSIEKGRLAPLQRAMAGDGAPATKR